MVKHTQFSKMATGHSDKEILQTGDILWQQVNQINGEQTNF